MVLFLNNSVLTSLRAYGFEPKAGHGASIIKVLGEDANLIKTVNVQTEEVLSASPVLKRCIKPNREFDMESFRRAFGDEFGTTYREIEETTNSLNFVFGTRTEIIAFVDDTLPKRLLNQRDLAARLLSAIGKTLSVENFLSSKAWETARATI